MAQSVVVTAAKPVQVRKYAITLAGIGALLITIDGIVGMIRNSLLVPTIGVFGLSVILVAAAEAVLGVIAIVSLYMSIETPSSVSYIVGVAALLALVVGGGFYFFGSAIALIGALLIHYRK